MTKKEKTIAWGIGAGAGLALIVYLAFMRRREIPELLPTQIQWAGNG